MTTINEDGQLEFVFVELEKLQGMSVKQLLEYKQDLCLAHDKIARAMSTKILKNDIWADFYFQLTNINKAHYDITIILMDKALEGDF